MASPPPGLLSQYLPDAGFQWVTMHRIPFTTFDQCVSICGAMSQAGNTINQAVVSEYLTEMFYNARMLAHKCEDMDPADFWQEVSTCQLWTIGLQGQDLYDFALRVMAARVTFRYRVKNYHQESPEIGDIPQRYRKRDHSVANKAVDEWISTIIHKYGMKSMTRRLYCPDGLTEPTIKWAPIGSYLSAKQTRVS